MSSRPRLHKFVRLIISSTVKNKIISLLLKILIFSLFSFHSYSSEQNWKPAQEGNKIILIRHSLAPGGGDPDKGFKIR